MSDIFVVKMDFIQTMAFAAILYWLGVTLCRRVKFLIRYNIPPAVSVVTIADIPVASPAFIVMPSVCECRSSL